MSRSAPEDAVHPTARLARSSNSPDTPPCRRCRALKRECDAESLLNTRAAGPAFWSSSAETRGRGGHRRRASAARNLWETLLGPGRAAGARERRKRLIAPSILAPARSRGRMRPRLVCSARSRRSQVRRSSRSRTSAVLAFEDIAPKAPRTCSLIPREHLASSLDSRRARTPRGRARRVRGASGEQRGFRARRLPCSCSTPTRPRVRRCSICTCTSSADAASAGRPGALTYTAAYSTVGVASSAGPRPAAAAAFLLIEARGRASRSRSPSRPHRQGARRPRRRKPRASSARRDGARRRRSEPGRLAPPPAPAEPDKELARGGPRGLNRLVEEKGRSDRGCEPRGARAARGESARVLRLRARDSRGRIEADPPQTRIGPRSNATGPVLHARAFRRLQYKTQVFPYSRCDHFRNRPPTRSRSAGRAHRRPRARPTRTCEAIVLSHDLGQPPFGTRASTRLNQLLKPQGGFEHNRQSLRIVDLARGSLRALPRTQPLARRRARHSETRLRLSALLASGAAARSGRGASIEGQIPDASTGSPITRTTSTTAARRHLEWDTLARFRCSQRRARCGGTRTRAATRGSARPRLTVRSSIGSRPDLIEASARRLERHPGVSAEESRVAARARGRFSPEIAAEKRELARFCSTTSIVTTACCAWRPKASASSAICGARTRRRVQLRRTCSRARRRARRARDRRLRGRHDDRSRWTSTIGCSTRTHTSSRALAARTNADRVRCLLGICRGEQ